MEELEYMLKHVKVPPVEEIEKLHKDVYQKVFDETDDEVSIIQLHRCAMSFMEAARCALLIGENDWIIRDSVEAAAAIEESVANLLKDMHETEPTRSMLYRTASALYLMRASYGDFRDYAPIAAELALEGLRGQHLPEHIKPELIELLSKCADY